MRQKGFVHILLLFIVALASIAGIGYFAYKKGQIKSNISNFSLNYANNSITPTSIVVFNEMSSWNTYINKEYGYQVRYPLDWKVIEAKPIDTPDWPYDRLSENQLHQVRFSETNYQLWEGSFAISVNKNPENMDTNKWAETFRVSLVADPTINLAKNLGKEMIDQRPVYKFEVFSFDSNNIVYGLVERGNIFTLSFGESDTNDDKHEEHQKIYNQILSTFKFTY